MRPGPQLLLTALMILAAGARPARANWPANGLPVFDGPDARWLMSTVAMPPSGSIASTGSPWAFVVAYGSSESPAWSTVGDWGTGPSNGLSGALAGYAPTGAATGYGPVGPAQTSGAGAVVLRGATQADGSPQLRIARPLQGSWPTTWPDTGYAVNEPVGAYPDPMRAVVGTADGGAVVGWSDVRAGVRGLYAQRFGEDGSPLWTAGGVHVAGPLPSEVFFERLWMVPDSGSLERPNGGGTWLVWTKPDAYPALRAARVQSDGTLSPGTPMGGVAFSSVNTWRINGVAADGEGGVYVVGTVGNQVLGWRLLANGSLAPGWPASGIIVNVPAAGLENVTVANLASELDVAWSDSSDTVTRWNVRAQRILPDGSQPAGWGPGGVAVTAGAGDEFASSITADLRVGWQDFPGPTPGMTPGTPHALALRADGTPDPIWPVGGTKLSDLAGAPTLVDNGGGGLIAVWQALFDANVGTTVYAQVVSASGRASTPPAQVPAALRLSEPSPNPATGSARVSLELPRAAHVEADVFDLAGRREAAVYSGELPAGTHVFTWDGRDAHGTPAATGVHFLRVSVDGAELTRTVVRLR